MSVFKRFRSKAAEELLEVPEPDRRRAADDREKEGLDRRVNQLEKRVDKIAEYLDIEAVTAAGVEAERE